MTNEVTEYAWDIRDRLTGVTVKNAGGAVIKTANYKYDVYDQRIAKTVDPDGVGALPAATERFVYGTNQNIALAFDGAGSLTHRYLFGDRIDQIEADESNGAVLWGLVDHLGSVRDVIDNSGTVKNHISYDSFGKVTAQTNSSVVFRYGYTGRELDGESGLQYTRARYLDSTNGRFISEDPSGFDSEDVNLYRYAKNNPVIYLDPSGLKIAPPQARTAPNTTPLRNPNSVPLRPYFPNQPLNPLTNPNQAPYNNGVTTPGWFQPIPFLPAFPTNITPYQPQQPQNQPNKSLKPNIPNPTFCPVDYDKIRKAIRVEVQSGTGKTGKDYGIPSQTFAKVGVTVIEAQNLITDFDVKVKSGAASWFSLKKYTAQFDKGIEQAREKVYEANRNGGTNDGEQKLSSVQWDVNGIYVKRGLFRVELINKNGINLTI